MVNQVQHDMLVKRTHDEEARQEYYVDIRRHLARNVAGGNRAVYAKVVKPNFLKEHGREPATRSEVRAVMTRNPYYQMYSAMQRHTQEMTWDSVIDSVERQLPDLADRAKRISGRSGGTLTLDPGFKVPPYLTFYDIHLQPGGYHTSLSGDDVSAGALYERATFMYSMGNLGPHGDYLGRSLVEHFKKRFPHIKPKRILDMGCTVGQSTLAWAEAFPDAEIHAIDVGESVLRYAHARAEGLGIKVHYAQKNAEDTGYPDGWFDVVLSHIIMHETATPAVPRIYAESLRLLRDGGVTMHMDNPRLKELPPFDAFLAEWEVHNNNEKFGGTYREMDLVSVAHKAGFSEGNATLEMIPFIAPPTVMNYTTKGFAFPCLVGVK
ncbi:MAG: methyltransferase domain-containing protein [Rhodobacteraceae bacterium]|nr:methyltransferase domain-containing protein [Paracoccaceae bacterium]